MCWNRSSPPSGIPARYRRNLLITLDGAGASYGLVNHLTKLNVSPWRSVQYSIGWELGARERTVIDRVPAPASGAVLDHDGHPRDLDEAGIVELTAWLREHPDGDQLANWPPDSRIICRREKPHRRPAVPVRRGRRMSLPTPDRHQHTRHDCAIPRTHHQQHARVEDNVAPAGKPASDTYRPPRSISTEPGAWPSTGKHPIPDPHNQPRFVEARRSPNATVGPAV
jgi:hypothetical protein